MVKAIFVNLPVKDLEVSKRFFTEIGYSIDQKYTDDTAACVVFSDTIYAMLLTEKKFAEFTDRPIVDAKAGTEAILALGVESREKVDEIAEKAVTAGGSKAGDPQDYGFMYFRAFHDPDGHLWEVLWTDPAMDQESSGNPSQSGR